MNLTKTRNTAKYLAIKELSGEHKEYSISALCEFAGIARAAYYKWSNHVNSDNDNLNEFNLSEELQPYVTKTYETNGLVTVAEYVNLIKEEEFLDSIPNIRNILNYLSENWMFSDVGTIVKNHTNWGKVLPLAG